MRVLIAEDDKELAAVLASHVTHCNHEVVGMVTTGGLDVIQSYDRYKPDVVLLDIMMPKFNGLTVCHALSSKVPKPKVVFVSGKVSSDYPHLANSQAVAFLQKPFRLEDLQRTLDEIAAQEPACG